MNYATEYFYPNRIVPCRRFDLPGILVKTWQGQSVSFVEGSTLFCSVVADKSIVALDEASLERTRVLFSSEELIGPPKAPVRGTFLIQEAVGGNIFKLNVSAVSYETGSVHRLLNESPVGIDRGTAELGGRYILLDPLDGWVAVDVASGDVRWRVSDAGEVVTFAADTVGGRIVSVANGFEIAGADLVSGTMVWKTRPSDLGLSWERGYGAAETNVFPHIFGNTAIVAMPGQHIVALDLNTGDLVWRWSAGDESDPYSYHPCVTEDGEIFHIANGMLYRLSAANGEGRAVGRITLNGSEPPFEVRAVFCDVTTTHVWGVTDRGVLYAVNRDSANIDWHIDLKGTYPLGHPFVLCNNRIYVQTAESAFVIEGAGGYRPD